MQSVEGIYVRLQKLLKGFVGVLWRYATVAF